MTRRSQILFFVVSSLDLAAAADSFSAVTQSLKESLGATDAAWTIFWTKLNLIFLTSFAACAITNMRGKSKGIGVVVIFASVAFGIGSVPSAFLVFADNFGKAFLLVACLVGAVAWPLVLGRYLGGECAAWKFSAALFAFEVICLLAMVNQSSPTP